MIAAGEIVTGKSKNTLRRLTDIVVGFSPVAALILSSLFLKADSAIRVSPEMVANYPKDLSFQADNNLIRTTAISETPAPPITINAIRAPSPEEAILP